MTCTFTSFEILATLLYRLEFSWVIVDVSHSVDTTVLPSTPVQQFEKQQTYSLRPRRKGHRERSTGAPLVQIFDGTSAVSREGDTSAVAKEGLFNARPLSLRERVNGCIEWSTKEHSMVTFLCRLRSFLFSLFRSFVHSSQPAVIQVLQCRNKSVYLIFPRSRPEDFEILLSDGCFGDKKYFTRSGIERGTKIEVLSYPWRSTLHLAGHESLRGFSLHCSVAQKQIPRL